MLQLADNAGISLAYEVSGPATGTPLLLISGASTPMFFWPDALVTALIDRGFQVARFDNRDTGASTRCADQPAYDLQDLAGDAVAVLDALGWESAHVMGVSLGGMVGQVLAVHHQERVRSLVSMSAAPAWSIRMLRPRLRTMIRVAAVYRRHRAGTREDVIAQWLELFPLIGSPRHPVASEWICEVAGRAYDLGHDPRAERRQTRAIAACGDRRGELARVSAPTLVVHGEQDPLQSVSAGRAAAAAIPGATLLILPEAGHGVPPETYWPRLLDAVVALTERAEATSDHGPPPPR